MASPNKISKSKRNVEKLQRKYLQEQQRRIKPGECIKYIKCVIEAYSLNSCLISEIRQQLDSNNIKYLINYDKVESIIFWERSDQQTLLTTSETLVSEKFTREPNILHIIKAEDFLEGVQSKSIRQNTEKLIKKFPNSIVTIIIYGIKNFNTNPNKKEIETVLLEIQIKYNCCHRCYETYTEIAQVIVQFSKAVAEAPFKMEQIEKFRDIDTFLLNDNKDCVRVEGTAGLSRLWQSHLTRLPLITLEVAETIINEYPNPAKLIEAYSNTTEEEGKDLLSNLKIRRGFGPLQANKRLGPELSKKIYILYNSLNSTDTL
ncbi:crossover junction endonuclease EME1 [Condylostylus longicornis]|uniref:crossover junction endonuclease EME1 n=1 Tax=Condylostylus longicornis TaxID=2530218 RepID=UPI00244DCA74|nr:crossover junction endonuclease EME1 [Condylostylus longicornis]